MMVFKSPLPRSVKASALLIFILLLKKKAATLLYLIIKNHSFVGGNKRIAACFLLFLEVNGLLKSDDGNLLISNEALASLTLFAADSKPEQMDTVKRLIIGVLNRNQ